MVDHISSGLLLPAGGHVETHESPIETVRREVVEVLGIQADFLYPGAVFLSEAETETETSGMAAGHHDVTLWYALNCDPSRQLEYIRSEFHAIRWFVRAHLALDRSEPNLARFVQKLVEMNG